MVALKPRTALKKMKQICVWLLTAHVLNSWEMLGRGTVNQRGQVARMRRNQLAAHFGWQLRAVFRGIIGRKANVR